MLLGAGRLIGLRNVDTPLLEMLLVSGNYFCCSAYALENAVNLGTGTTTGDPTLDDALADGKIL